MTPPAATILAGCDACERPAFTVCSDPAWAGSDAQNSPKKPMKAGNEAIFISGSIFARDCCFRTQFLKAHELLGLQVFRLVSRDENLEHRLPVMVDELHRARAPFEKRAIDEIDRSATFDLQMAAERTIAMDVEISP